MALSVSDPCGLCDSLSDADLIDVMGEATCDESTAIALRLAAIGELDARRCRELALALSLASGRMCTPTMCRRPQALLPHTPPMADLVGMLQWCQDNTDELTEAETMALQGPMMRACHAGPDGQMKLSIHDADPFELHADLWTVVLQIAENHHLIPEDERPE